MKIRTPTETLLLVLFVLLTLVILVLAAVAPPNLLNINSIYQGF
jgi:uncharacterized membrane protein YqjE